MKIVVGRFKDGRLKVVKILEDKDSNFWKSNNSECLRYDHKKDEIEAVLMVDVWNNNYHEKFERIWNSLKNMVNSKREKTV